MNAIKAALLGAVLLLAGSVSEARTRKATVDSTSTPAFVWPRLRIGVDLGGAYAVGKVEEGLTPELEEQERRMKFGAIAGVDVSWFFKKWLGVGVKGKLMYSFSEVDMPVDGSYILMHLSEKAKMPFVGPMICTRVYSKSGKHCFVANLSVGYCGIFDDFFFLTKGKMWASTCGLCTDIGYDLRLTKHLSLGFQLSAVEAYLFKADQMKIEHNFLTQESIKELWGKDPRTMSHIDFTIGLRYNIECRGKHK